MSLATVPISDASRQMLQQLAEHTGQSMSDVLDKALEAYRRKVFLDAVNAGYAALRDDPVAWAEFESERKEWDATLMDGLDLNERWSEDGRCLTTPDEGKKHG
jgi:hypothetical protein